LRTSISVHDNNSEFKAEIDSDLSYTEQTINFSNEFVDLPKIILTTEQMEWENSGLIHFEVRVTCVTTTDFTFRVFSSSSKKL